jgi:hypothetical protein
VVPDARRLLHRPAAGRPAPVRHQPSSGSQVFSRVYGGRPPPLTKHWRRALARDFVRWRVGGVYLWRNPKVVTTPPEEKKKAAAKT